MAGERYKVEELSIVQLAPERDRKFNVLDANGVKIAHVEHRPERSYAAPFWFIEIEDRRREDVVGALTAILAEINGDQWWCKK